MSARYRHPSGKGELVERLEPYPLSCACFSPYVTACAAADSAVLKDHDLIRVFGVNDAERLQLVEKLLRKAADLLSLTDSEFARIFGFHNELNIEDPAKIHDLLAEPFMVCELADLGFSSFRKLPRWIKKGNEKLPNSDLIAVRNSTQFVIEVKTIREENKPRPKPGMLIGDATRPSWWSRMLISNATMKIRDKKCRVLKQLENAKSEYGADKAMLALYTRRISAVLMETESYLDAMRQLSSVYPQIDFFAFKDRFSPVVVFPRLESK